MPRVNPVVVWVTLVCWLQTVSANKQLIFFAGPHHAASSSVETFFSNHASGYFNSVVSEGLQGWIWPPVREELWHDGHVVEKPSRFNMLVIQDSNETAQDILSTAIRSAWNESQFGIIIGTPEFDRIGETSFTHRDGLKAMKKIVIQLGVAPEDVTVVLNYRTPRLTQWISVWKNALENEEGLHYKKFLCGVGNTEERLELLDTAMNPLKLAQVYRGEKWQVAVMDMAGVEAEGLDLTHTIACKVLPHTTCKDGFVVPIMQTYHEKKGIEKDLNSLSEPEKKELEQLFLERDCYYEPTMRKDDGVVIYSEHEIWKGCQSDDESHLKYAELTDSQLMINAIKTQKGCAHDKVHMTDVLVNSEVGHSSQTVLHSGKDQGGAPVDEFSAANSAYHESNADSPIVMVLFIIIAGGLSIQQLQAIHQSSRRLQGGGGEQELGDLPGGSPSAGELSLASHEDAEVI